MGSLLNAFVARIADPRREGRPVVYTGAGEAKAFFAKSGKMFAMWKMIP
jgi:hypothetical protein